MLGPALFAGFSLPLFFFSTFIMIFGCMVDIHSINFLFRIVLGEPPPILAISGNVFLWFIDSPGFKIFKLLNIILFGLPYFSGGVDLVSLKFSSLDCCKYRTSILSNLDIIIIISHGLSMYWIPLRGFPHASCFTWG